MLDSLNAGQRWNEAKPDKASTGNAVRALDTGVAVKVVGSLL